MSKQVWKFQLGAGVNKLQMPLHSDVIHVGGQHGCVCLWAVVYPDHLKEERTFFLAGTGHDLPDECGKRTYIGTAHVDDSNFIFHVFAVDGVEPPTA